MARRSKEQWKQLVREHDRSGLSTARFARHRGLNANTLQFWRWKLGRGGPKRQAKRRTSTKAAPPVRLLPVRMTDGRSSASASSVAGAGGRASITISTGGEVRVEVTLDVDPRDVARLVAALRGVTC